MMELTLSNLSKSYGNTKALISFTTNLSPGVYGLLGPNGAGKTTLMNIITGNLEPDEGRILFNGEDIAVMGSRFREVLGYMPQQQDLYDSFSAKRFLWYMASLKGLPKKAARKKIAELLELVNLHDHAHRKIGNFSGGMKQRVLIAQALLNDPKVLLMDEPTAGLDPQERIRIRNFISEISFNKIVMLATHVVSDVDFIAKEIILLRNGQVVAQQDPGEILSEMNGRVFEVLVSENEIAKLQKECKVSNITKDKNAVRVRIVADQAPEGYSCNSVRPNMEDVYLYKLVK